MTGIDIVSFLLKNHIRKKKIIIFYLHLIIRSNLPTLIIEEKVLRKTS